MRTKKIDGGFSVQCSVFSVQGSGFRVQGSGSSVQGSVFSVQGSGFREREALGDTRMAIKFCRRKGGAL